MFFQIDTTILLHHKSQVKHGMQQLYFLKEELFKNNYSLWADGNKEQVMLLLKKTLNIQQYNTQCSIEEPKH